MAEKHSPLPGLKITGVIAKAGARAHGFLSEDRYSIKSTNS